ncbi:thiol:disulfide interchange protein DsbD [Mucilaginibacter lappiensis]|uniref:Thiol:disulfide interchange protein DsbD n=1 Tax=Mucilaginibacter lappiensis TaxID=354630 RepID=A0ABR6PQC5_9SPHI|nr:protein-disulfide reductase DsbD domain-containing protein [Mucilaginibacter lappiensis]MBB6111846.1 thiol:disulfide interchange protein DsbD [Mucilaginibacter lappiensis]SIR88545.1 thiol:disulfide interchange protein DsbD [Mucilaginibacter lappiensis]
MKKVLLVIVALVMCAGAYAQIETPVRWSYAAKKLNDKEAIVFLKATIQPSWHIYSLNVKDGGPIKTSFEFTPSKLYVPIGKTSEPTPVTKYEKAFSMNVSYFEKEVVFQQKISLKSASATSVTGKLTYMTCNDKKCLPPEDVDFTIPLGK